MWLYNGTFPGPTMVQRYGQPTVLRRINKLDPNYVGFGLPETSMHHHGGHQGPVDDGWPLDFITPNQYRDHLFPNIVPAGDTNEWPSTLWYHDHTIDHTAGNVYHGLAGLSLHFDNLDKGNERDATGGNLRLPSGYFDIPLVFRDVALNQDGSLYFDQLNDKGQVGNLLTVNGKVAPYLNVSRRKYRFRLLAGSMAREWLLGLSDGSEFHVIASDGGLLPAPAPVTELHQGNAERYEIIVDFSKYEIGTQITLNDYLVYGGDGNKPEGVLDFGFGTPLMMFRVLRDAVDYSQMPDQLRPLTPVDQLPIAATRDIVLHRTNGMWVINGTPWNPLVPMFTPKVNTFEIWNVSVQGGGWNHPLHIHQEFFRILKRNGLAPRPHEAGRKDTVLLWNDSPCQLLVGFRTYTGPYVFHCHNLGHEDMAMMAWYDVQP